MNNTITKYFHHAVTAQCNPRIDFANTKYVILSKNDFEKGLVSEDVLNRYIKEIGNCKDESFNVIIAAKTVVTHFVQGVRHNEQPDDLTSVFFIPAVLTVDGTLKFCQKYPIIPREYLEPMIEADVSIGEIERLNQYFLKNVAEFSQLKTWSAYLNFSKRMFEFVTGQHFEQLQLNESIQFDGKYYLFKDETVYASKGIADLYENIELQTKPLPLYQTLTAMDAPKPVQRTSIDNVESMLTHCASMGGLFPLSPSQREAVINFNKLNESEILAVSGPPGTGKTTLLQSIVAGMVTKHALMKKDPPVIIASSTNNQAVTNIIDSFGKIESIWESLRIEEHWLPTINSFAVFFPSASKMTDEYQCIDKEYSFLADISTSEYKKEATKSLLAKYASYSGEHCCNVSDCKAGLYKLLSDIDELRQAIISKTARIAQVAKPDVQTFLKSVDEQIKECQADKDKLNIKITNLQDQNMKYKDRIKQWKDSYAKLPFFVRLLNFFKFSKRKMQVWYLTFRTEEESALFTDNEPNIDKITEIYSQHIRQNDDELVSVKNELLQIEKKKKELLALKEQTETEKNIIINMIREQPFAAQIINDSHYETLEKCVLDDTNTVIDTTLRYLEFWLAVHYYECEFLEQNPLTEKQLKSNLHDVQILKLRRLAMICPCMVMTFFMLPKNLRVYRINERKNDYLYNFADLLIADEAGQTSPEIAAASFALAKNAVIVGDDYQIPPVWGTSHALDVTLAVESQTIRSVQDYKLLETNGLNASESSLMRAASFSCKFHKFGPGLFLSEHRRCYNEIIGYCNELLYEGHLEPLRGKSTGGLPCMGYYDIPLAHAEKVGTSRANKHEAIEIAKWLNLNYEKLFSHYPDKKKEDILAVITPFKEQTKMLKSAIRNYCTEIPNAEQIIQVGTVHTFQGAERQVIIFSTVYGYEDNCGFIDGNKNLMNVAVSRAKDSFWVFGSIGCLKGKSQESASGLMYTYIKDHPIEQTLS